MKNIYWMSILIIYIIWICVINTSIKKKIYQSIICIVLIVGIYSVYGNVLAAIVFSLILPFLYSIIVGITNVRTEKKLFNGIESKMRHMANVYERTYEDNKNVFNRCIVVESDMSEVKSQLILIVPQIPKYMYLVDYNGNCVNEVGEYVEASMIYNYAPYNEIAERLAQEGYVVVRLDMFCKEVREINIIDYVEGITEWIRRIKKDTGIDRNPIVIGHRENGNLTVRLMKYNHWEDGILLCCGLNYNYMIEGKSCYEDLKELTNEYTIVQIDTGLGENKRKEDEDKNILQCNYSVNKIVNMDYSLRKHDFLHKRKYFEKGYGIKCGTGEFPPVCEELMILLKNILTKMMG